MEHHNYIQLLTKQLSGEIEPIEQVALEEWIQQSPENARIASQYSLAWNEVPATYGEWPFPVDLDADYALLEAKMQPAQKPEAIVVPMGNWRRNLMRVAAVGAFLAVAWFGYRQMNAQAGWVMIKADGATKYTVLPDGSKVWLRENAQLSYPADIVSAKSRKVKLSGEAFFEVTHDVEHPFSVITDEGNEVEVLGTQFDVKSVGDATEVLVKSGKVRFSPDDKQQGEVVMAGKKGVLTAGSNVVTITPVNTFNELAWHAGGLEFIKTPLAQVVTDLNEYYHVDIELENKSISGCSYTSPIVNQPIESVLNSLAITFQLKVNKVDNGKYVLSGGSCN